MYKLQKLEELGKYKIVIMKSNVIFDEDFFAEFILEKVLSTDLTSYDISHKVVLEMLIQECNNKISTTGWQLNDGSEFEALTNIFLSDVLEHDVIDDVVLFSAEKGIDILSFNNIDKKLNISEVKSSVTKQKRPHEEEKEIFYVKLKEAFESQLCKKRNVTNQFTKHVPNVQKKYSEQDAKYIINILKEINSTHKTTSVVTNEFDNSLEFNNFIWCSSSFEVDIESVKKFLVKSADVNETTGKETCCYCGKESCNNSALFHHENNNHALTYNLYLTRLSDVFSMQNYYTKLSEKIGKKIAKL